MLPFSLTDGWAVVGDSKDMTFEAVWEDTHVVGTLRANRDEIVIAPTAGGPELVMPLPLFEQLATRAIIAAHCRP